MEMYEIINMFIFYVTLKNVKKARQYSHSLRELFNKVLNDLRFCNIFPYLYPENILIKFHCIKLEQPYIWSNCNKE